MDPELTKLILSQGVACSLLFFALKWVLKDRDKGWETAAKEGHARIAILEKQSSARTEELVAMRSEFSAYRSSTQTDINTIHANHNAQIMLITSQYNKQIEGLQQEIRGLYKMLIEARMCPVENDLPSPQIMKKGEIS